MGACCRQRVHILFAVGAMTLVYFAFSPSKVLTGKRIQARREAASRTLDIASLMTLKPAPEALGLRVDESVTYIHPETNEVIEFTVVSFGMSKGRGRWFTVTYTGNPHLEVEVREQTMREMLTTRVEIEDWRGVFLVALMLYLCSGSSIILISLVPDAGYLFPPGDKRSYKCEIGLLTHCPLSMILHAIRHGTGTAHLQVDRTSRDRGVLIFLAQKVRRAQNVRQTHAQRTKIHPQNKGQGYKACSGL
jgi:hypothetical protein